MACAWTCDSGWPQIYLVKVQYHEIVHVMLREWHHITILIIYAITITFVLLTCTHVIFKYDYHGWMASRIVYVCSLAPHIQYPPSA